MGINILVRGKPRSGKSTLIQRLLPLLKNEGKTIGGISTPEIRKGNRVGFAIVNIMTGEQGILAHVNQPQGPRVSRYRVNLNDLQRLGVQGIKQALEAKVDVIIIDEIGKMELVSQAFQDVVWSALDQQKVLGTIGRITHPFVSKTYQRKDVMVLDLTPQNRNQMLHEIQKLLEKS